MQIVTIYIQKKAEISPSYSRLHRFFAKFDTEFNAPFGFPDIDGQTRKRTLPAPFQRTGHTFIPARSSAFITSCYKPASATPLQGDQWIVMKLSRRLTGCLAREHKNARFPVHRTKTVNPAVTQFRKAWTARVAKNGCPSLASSIANTDASTSPIRNVMHIYSVL